MSGVVANTCNPSYSGGRELEDHSSRTAQAKKLARLHLKLGMVVHALDPSYVEGICKKIVVLLCFSPGQNKKYKTLAGK
jgi:hypothetical protein